MSDSPDGIPPDWPEESAQRLSKSRQLREPGTPSAVIIDEAVELAKRFGEADSPAFVNGVLDAIRKKVRGEAARDSEGAKQER